MPKKPDDITIATAMLAEEEERRATKRRAKRMPDQNRGASKQDFATPRPFLRALEAKLGIKAFDWDLAAHAKNAICEQYISPKQDSLSVAWTSLKGWLWLNPPFADITPWAKKCAEEAPLGCRIALLTPASVGSAWFRDYVHGRARVLFLGPKRLSFDGINGYPKDLILSIYASAGPPPPGYEPWNWAEDARKLGQKP